MSLLYGVAAVNSGDVVSMATNAGLNAPEPYTLVLWGFPNSLGKARPGTVGRLMTRDSAAVVGYMVWRHFSDTTVGNKDTNQVAFFENFTVTDVEVITSSNALTIGRWNHYAATWDGTTNASNAKLYLQGSEPALYASRTNGVGTLQLDTSPRFTVGNRGGAFSAYDGTLAFGAIYGFVMTSNQIVHEMWIPGSHNYPGTKAFWPLYGTPTENDYSGNQNNGLVTGVAVGVLQPPINGIGTVNPPSMAY